MSEKLIHPNALKMLKTDWVEAKKQGMTQLEMSRLLGMKQPTFSQYLNGTIPLNLSFLVNYATIRQVPLQSVGIVESLTEFRPEQFKLRVERATSGLRFQNRYVPASGFLSTPDAYLVEVDTDYKSLPKGAFLVCEALPCYRNDHVIALRDDVMKVGVLGLYGSEWALLESGPFAENAMFIDQSWQLRRVTSILFVANAQQTEPF